MYQIVNLNKSLLYKDWMDIRALISQEGLSLLQFNNNTCFTTVQGVISYVQSELFDFKLLSRYLSP